MLAKMGTVWLGLILPQAGVCRAEQHPFCSGQQVVQEQGHWRAAETRAWWEDAEAEESPSPGPLTVIGPNGNVASAIPLQQDDDGCPGQPQPPPHGQNN